jgi:hypothetical protein
MPDQLSSLYGGLLDGSYDCVDRVVLNAYFSMGQSGAAFALGGGSYTVRIKTWTITI